MSSHSLFPPPYLMVYRLTIGGVMVYVVLIVIAAGLMALPRTLPTWATCLVSLAGLVAALIITYHHVVVTFG